MATIYATPDFSRCVGTAPFSVETDIHNFYVDSESGFCELPDVVEEHSEVATTYPLEENNRSAAAAEVSSSTSRAILEHHSTEGIESDERLQEDASKEWLALDDHLLPTLCKAEPLETSCTLKLENHNPNERFLLSQEPPTTELLPRQRRRKSMRTSDHLRETVKPMTDENKQIQRNAPAKRWTYEEEVLLIGAIFIVFAEKGSLFPARRKGKKVGVYTKQCESDTFERVNEIFEECKVLTSRQYLEPRAPKALCRHFKQMKERYINQTCPENSDAEGFMPLIETWMEECGSYLLNDPANVRFPDHKLKNAWTVEEETVLVGAVFERFFSKGSLCTNKRRPSDVDCWKDVKRFYDRAWSRLDIKKPSERSAMVLGSQYRKLKKRIHRAKANGLKPYIEAYMVLDRGYTPKRGKLSK